MAALHDYQNRLRPKSQLQLADYLFLVLSICGFGFAGILLIRDFISKKMSQHHSSAEAGSGFEAAIDGAGGIHTQSLPSPLAPALVDTTNNTSGHAQLLNPEISKECFHRDQISKSRDSEIQRFREGGKTSESSQQESFSEGNFHSIHPEMSYSLRSIPEKIKPSIPVSEMTNEELLIEEKNKKYNLKDFNNIDKGYMFDFNRSNQLSATEEHSPLNSGREKIGFSQNNIFETMKISSNESNNVEMNDSSTSSSTTNNSSDGTVDSEEDSDTSSESRESSDSFKEYTKKFLKKQIFPQNIDIPDPRKSVINRISSVMDHISSLEEIGKQLSNIGTEIKSLPIPAKFDLSNYSLESGIENVMQDKFESLQRNISSFLDHTKIFETCRNDLLNLDLGGREPSNSNLSQQTQEDTKRHPRHKRPRSKNNNQMLQFQFPHSSGGNILQDGSIPNSSEPFLLSEDHRDLENRSKIQNVTEYNSEYLHEPRNFIINFNEKPQLNNHKHKNNQPSHTKITNNPAKIFTNKVSLNENSDEFIHESLSLLFGQANELNISLAVDEKSVIKDDTVKDEIVPILKDQSDEDVVQWTTCSNNCQRPSCLHAPWKGMQSNRKSYFTNKDNNTTPGFPFRQGNVQDAIKLFESGVIDKAKISTKSYNTSQ